MNRFQMRQPDGTMSGAVKSGCAVLRPWKTLVLMLVALTAVILGTTPMQAGPAVAPQKAIAVLHPASGSSVQGVVTFTKVAGGIRVEADLVGLKPGKHGFHIHEFGDCSAPDAMSAGGHFNPHKMHHASPDASQRHEGDLGNVTADANGKAHLDYVDRQIRLDGPDSIIGRSVVVHEKEDDFKTQPTGNAGSRQACGVVGIAKPTP